MTNKMRFQLSIAVFILSGLVFISFTFVPQLARLKTADFLQGFSGGIAFGTLLGIMHYGRKLRRETRMA